MTIRTAAVALLLFASACSAGTDDDAAPPLTTSTTSPTTTSPKNGASEAGGVPTTVIGGAAVPTTALTAAQPPTSLSKAFEEAGAELEVEACTATITVRNDALGFAAGSADIGNWEHMAEIVSLVEGATSVVITGHASSEGAAEMNQVLSEQRANAVVNAIAQMLRQADKPVPAMSPDGMGEDQPIADNDTEDGRAANRRVEIAASFEECLPTAPDS